MPMALSDPRVWIRLEMNRVPAARTAMALFHPFIFAGVFGYVFYSVIGRDWLPQPSFGANRLLPRFK